MFIQNSRAQSDTFGLDNNWYRIPRWTSRLSNIIILLKKQSIDSVELKLDQIFVLKYFALIDWWVCDIFKAVTEIEQKIKTKNCVHDC